MLSVSALKSNGLAGLFALIRSNLCTRPVTYRFGFVCTRAGITIGRIRAFFVREPNSGGITPVPKRYRAIYSAALGPTCFPRTCSRRCAKTPPTLSTHELADHLRTKHLNTIIGQLHID